MNEKIPIVILVGPTAVGKTDLSIQIAKNINGEIISADSMQIYKYMDIGSAKITEDEMNGVKHYLIDEITPDTEFSVSDFQKLAKKYIKEIYNKSKIPVIVGGTGLYINSLLYNLDFSKTISNIDYRNELTEKANKYGNEYIYDILKEVDPNSLSRIHLNDTKRIIRALEIYKETGKPMSHFYNNFRERNTDYDVAYIALNMERIKLYDRVNKRVDIMINNGLIEEVQNLLDKGFDKNLVSMQGLGYKEIVSYLEGVFSLDVAIEILKRDTRRYAKRQLTWFRRDENVHWVNIDNFKDRNEVLEHVLHYIKDILELKF